MLPALRGPLAMTTDSFVVSPLFFPGGDIGSLRRVWHGQRPGRRRREAALD